MGQVMHLLHSIGMGLGVLGAFAAGAVMLVLPAGDEARRKRGRIARFISPFTWLGLLLLLVSGGLMTAHGAAEEGYELWILLKHAFVVIICVDALVIHFRLFPRYFRQIGTPEVVATHRRMRAVGALSVFSWAAALALSFGGERLFG